MSIRQEIWNRVTEGRIRQLSKHVPTDPSLRSVYLTRKLHDQVFMDRWDIKDIERFAYLEADLEHFVISKTLKSTYLYGLSPVLEGIWEIRSRRPRPSIRVFCMFAAKDTLVCTHLALRKDLGEDFQAEIRMAKAIWRQLFNPYNPLCSNNVNELFTGALHDQYFKS